MGSISQEKWIYKITGRCEASFLFRGFLNMNLAIAIMIIRMIEKLSE